jgi:hypothetical protein
VEVPVSAVETGTVPPFTSVYPIVFTPTIQTATAVATSVAAVAELLLNPFNPLFL